MPRSSFRLMLAAAVVFPMACGRSPRPGGAEGAPAGKDTPVPRTSQILRARLSATQPPAAYARGDARAAETWKGVRRLYESTGYQPV